MSIPIGRIYNADQLRKICSKKKQESLTLPVDKPSELSDSSGNDVLMQITQRSSVASLWAGDTSGYSNDHSRADLALCYELARLTNCDKAQMDKLFRESGLYRDKWDEKRGDTTYGCMTIEKAIRFVQEKPLDLSDASELGTANRFVKRYSTRCCHVPEVGWTYLDEGRWKITGGQARAKSMMIDMCEDIYSQALRNYAQKTRDGPAETTVKNASKMRSNIHIDGALKLAESKLYTPFADFDRDPYVLNTPDGIIDLRTGNIVPHSLEMKCTHCTNISPLGASNGKWEEHVRRITGYDEDLFRYMRLLIGMMAFGRVCEEVLMIAYGEGSNGKSTYFNAIQKALGSYSITVSPEIFQASRSRSEKTDFHVLKGTRCVLAYETEEYKGISPAKMKRLTSTDRIEARVYYKNAYSFDPSHTIVLVTNHLPNLDSLDHGTWRRITVLPFNTQIEHAEAVTNYAEMLVEEDGVGIVQYILEGAREFAENNF
ncbi:phage/plasmid primase, P4 family [Eubacteriales bacterium OttesenSCG-928-A19]|nr:phage/plasmid primase, P4 family [Eubacteriales bacterium OttesenSCG-928-A19]